MKKSITGSIVLIAILLVALFALSRIPSGHMPAPSNDTGGNEADGGQLQYRSAEGGFAIPYPEEAEIIRRIDDRKLYPDDGTVGGSQIIDFVGFYLPSGVFPQTNFREAELDIVVYDTPVCPEVAAPVEQAGEEVISGIPFRAVRVSDAAAGNRYEAVIDSAEHGNRCYIMTRTVHTAVLENYDPSLGIQPVDEQQLGALLSSIVQSFTIAP